MAPDAGSAPCLRNQLLGALRTVMDPCSIGWGVPVDIVGLGLVDIAVDEAHGEAAVRLTPTAPECLMVGHIGEQVRQALASVTDLASTSLTIGDPLDWDPSRIDAPTREVLRHRREARRRATAVVIEGMVSSGDGGGAQENRR